MWAICRSAFFSLGTAGMLDIQPNVASWCRRIECLSKTLLVAEGLIKKMTPTVLRW